MIEFLITILFLLIILYVVNLVINALNLPENIKRIIWLIIGVFVLLMGLQYFGLYDAHINLPK